MSNVPTTTLPLPEALNGVVLSDSERAFLAWLAGFEVHTMENIPVAHSRPTDLAGQSIKIHRQNRT